MSIQALIQPEQIDFLPIQRLAPSGAVVNQFPRFDGTTWQPVSLPIVSGSQAGILPAFPNNPTQVLHGDGVWRVPTVGGVSGVSGSTNWFVSGNQLFGQNLTTTNGIVTAFNNITLNLPTSGGAAYTFRVADTANTQLFVGNNGVVRFMGAGGVSTVLTDVAGVATLTITGSSGVSSFNTRTGAVIPELNDYAAFYMPINRQWTPVGGNITGIINSNGTFTLNAPAGSGGITTGNYGAGVAVLVPQAIPQSIIYGKTLVAGANITLTDTGTEIYIASGSGGGGGGGGVASFNGRTGNVSPQVNDYSSFYLPTTHQYFASGGNVTGTIGPGNTFTLNASGGGGGSNIQIQWNGATQAVSSAINFTGNVSVIGNTVNIPTGSGGSGISINGAGSYTNIQFNTSHFDVFGNLIQLKNVAGGVTQVTSGLPSVLSVLPTSGNVVVTPVGMNTTLTPSFNSTTGVLTLQAPTFTGGVLSSSSNVFITLPAGGGGGLPSGFNDWTIRHNGTTWEATDKILVTSNQVVISAVPGVFNAGTVYANPSSASIEAGGIVSVSTAFVSLGFPGTAGIPGAIRNIVIDSNGRIGFFGATPVTRPNVNPASLSDIANALKNLGLINF